MPLFTSPREKRLWLFTGIVIMAIFSTLVLSRPLLGVLENQNIQAVIFLLGMALVGMTIMVYGLKKRPGKREIVIWLGLIAVYLMLFLRLGLSERSHLIEYSVLAIFIHQALTERISQKEKWFIPALLAFAGTVIMGVIDECFQLLIPDRVFDPEDMVFNSFAAFMAILTSLLLQWARKKFGHKQT